MQLHTKSVLSNLLEFFCVQLIGYFSITFGFNSLTIKLHVNLVYLIRVNGESSINSDLIIQYFSLLLVTNYDFRV